MCNTQIQSVFIDYSTRQHTPSWNPFSLQPFCTANFPQIGGKQHVRSKIRSVFAGQLTRQHAPGNPPGPSHLTHTRVRSIFLTLPQTNKQRRCTIFTFLAKKHFTVQDHTSITQFKHTPLQVNSEIIYLPHRIFLKVIPQ